MSNVHGSASISVQRTNCLDVRPPSEILKQSSRVRCCYRNVFQAWATHLFPCHLQQFLLPVESWSKDWNRYMKSSSQLVAGVSSHFHSFRYWSFMWCTSALANAGDTARTLCQFSLTNVQDPAAHPNVHLWRINAIRVCYFVVPIYSYQDRKKVRVTVIIQNLGDNNQLVSVLL